MRKKYNVSVPGKPGLPSTQGVGGREGVGAVLTPSVG